MGALIYIGVIVSACILYGIYSYRKMVNKTIKAYDYITKHPYRIIYNGNKKKYIIEQAYINNDSEIGYDSKFDMHSFDTENEAMNMLDIVQQPKVEDIVIYTVGIDDVK